MATSVKMDDETKSKLEELQAEIKLATGKKVTQQEVLARLVDRTYASKDAFVESFRDRTVPLSDEEMAALDEGIVDSGTVTREEDIDDVLYG